MRGFRWAILAAVGVVMHMGVGCGSGDPDPHGLGQTKLADSADPALQEQLAALTSPEGLAVPTVTLSATRGSPFTMDVYPIALHAAVPASANFGGELVLNLTLYDGTSLTCTYDAQGRHCSGTASVENIGAVRGISVSVVGTDPSGAGSITFSPLRLTLDNFTANLVAVLTPILNFFLPFATVDTPHEPNPVGVKQELSAAALSTDEASGACGGTEPQIAFTVSSGEVVYGPLSCVQSGTCMNVVPSDQLVPPDDGTCKYKPFYTDSLMATLPGGRLLRAALVAKCCPGATSETCTPSDPTIVVDPTGGCGAGMYQKTRAISVSISRDCGATWNSTAIDADTFSDPSTGAPLPFFDRPELFVDPYSDRVFISGRQAKTILYPCDGGAPNYQVIRVASKGAATDTSLGFEVYSAVPNGTPVTVMGAVPTPFGDRFARLHCDGANVVLDVERSPGVAEDPVSATIATDCAIVGDGQPGGLTNRVPPLGLAAEYPAEGLPAFYAAYPSVTNGYQIARVDHVALFHVNPVVIAGFTIIPAYDAVFPQPIQTVDLSAANTDVIWTHLLDIPDSDATHFHTPLLRWAEVSGNSVSERVEPLFSYTGPGRMSLVDSWTIAPGAFGAVKCDAKTPCFAGDYHYGTTIDRQAGGSRRSLLMWSAPGAIGRMDAWATVATTSR